MRVLIAEDEVFLARSLKYLLEKQKFVVDIVHNGLEALDFFHTTCLLYTSPSPRDS